MSTGVSNFREGQLVALAHDPTKVGRVVSITLSSKDQSDNGIMIAMGRKPKVRKGFAPVSYFESRLVAVVDDGGFGRGFWPGYWTGVGVMVFTAILVNIVFPAFFGH